MNIPILTQLVILIEEVFKVHGTTVAKAAGEAAASAALSNVGQDPRVQVVTEASATFLAAAQSLKAALETHAADEQSGRGA